MAAMTRFLNSEPTLAWLGQLSPDEQGLAIEMLRKMLLVSRDAFTERLIALLLTRCSAGPEPVGLYAEREVRKRHGQPLRLFKQSNTKIKRAHGAGPQPVQTFRAYDADIGSEGIVAQLVSEVSRRHPKRFLSHPGPDQIRKFKVRRFILVSDFIGSGDRARTYIEAAWRVKSVRSWWSSRAKHGMSFEVVAYTGTERGVATVASHPSKPEVHLVAVCPTVLNSFSYEKRLAILALCQKYYLGTPSMPALGYGSTGALVAFSHGAPNNCPLIFHKRSGSWEPLFPERVTAASRQTFAEEQDRGERLRERLIDMRQSRLAAAGVADAADPKRRSLAAAMAALAHPPRTAHSVALRTGLTIAEVERLLGKALKSGWVDGLNRLTDMGHAELEQLRVTRPLLPLSPTLKDDYCPKQLRAPVGSHS
ncbi:phosphoribosyltransferase-like protein [Sphingomonas pruni]|uniref:phosphoribosyltransferase-like protein n=1 Tax=Sphingomonas pruni TaxID=40683 RepID=UPI0008307FD0|nr:hypothetical protein [Sphingomonas pruni]